MDRKNINCISTLSQGHFTPRVKIEKPTFIQCCNVSENWKRYLIYFIAASSEEAGEAGSYFISISRPPKSLQNQLKQSRTALINFTQ